MSIPQEIFKKVETLFLRYGIKSVTMDDIARELGISKKTIYQYVSNKNELVHRVMQAYIDRDSREIKELKQGAKNAIEEWTRIFNYSCNVFVDFNPNILYDLQKYYPEGWQAFEAYKHKHIYSVVLHNLQRGIEEGLYRNNINPEVIAGIYINKLEAFVDINNFPSRGITIQEIFDHLIEYHLRGIASAKGAKILDSIKQKQQ